MLLSLLQNWRSSLDKSSPCNIAVISLDVCKAFDSINHSLLLKTIKNDFCFSEGSAALIKSYLTNRKQAFKINSATSDLRPITRGVPQGSILGPILFIMAVNKLLTTFPNTFAYADDTIIYTEAPDQSTVTHQANQRC